MESFLFSVLAKMMSVKTTAEHKESSIEHRELPV